MINSTSTFSAGGGKITTDFGGIDAGFDVTLQNDGKILVTGLTTDADLTAHALLARYNVDGSLDSSFSGDGTVIIDFGKESLATSIAVQNDGKILVTGIIIDGSGVEEFFLNRYNADGSPDSTFSGDGRVSTDFGGLHAGCSVVTQSDGRILVAGDHDGDFALVRYNSDGSLDSGFSGNGIVTTDFGGLDGGDSLAVQNNGKVLVAGSSWSGSNWNFAVARYNADGSLDTSFSGDGKVLTAIGIESVSQALALQADGKIVVGGVGVTMGLTFFALVRYNTDGSLDTTFSGDGVVVTNFAEFSVVESVNILADGRILVGGFSNWDFTLVRYKSDGSLDTTFSGDGKVTTDFGGYDGINGIAIQSDGKIVAAGLSDEDFALARYNSDGSLDTSSSFAGTSGDDTLHSSTGNEAFNGGAGVDTVIFSGHESDYMITLAGTGFSFNDTVGTDGTDTIVNIEKLQFSDHTLTIAATPNVTLLESYRIYKAAFDRAPDYDGLGFWYHSMNAGESLTKVAEGFINSNEFRAMYGDNPTDSTFVTLLYQHVLGRIPDMGGCDFWMNDLKVETRAQVLAHFSESAENIANLVGVIANGIIYEEYPG